jgi:hypothetical protein
MAAKKKKKAKKAKAVKAKKSPAKKSPAQKSKAKKAAKRPAKQAAKKAGKPTKKAVKAAAKKAPAKKTRKASAKKKQIVGEGDYAATRKFDKAQANFVERNKASIPAMGEAAEKALEGPEGDSLRDAEATAAARSRDTF